MKISKIAFSLAAGLVSLAGAASAQVVYNNPYNFGGTGGDCSFNTNCAGVFGRGDEFAAQAFTLTQATVITGAAWTELDGGTGPTTSPSSANWGFIKADGAGGLPGTILAAGSDNITSVNFLGSDYGLNVNQEVFGIGSLYLLPGTYYLAIQAVSPAFGVYLGQGVNQTGAAETNDGGVTWSSGYENGAYGAELGGVAVELFGSTVPEPASWAVMLIGLGGIGVAMRRRAKAGATAA